MTAAQAPAQAVEVCFRTKGARRQVFVRPQGSHQWRGWSVPRADLAVKRGAITIPASSTHRSSCAHRWRTDRVHRPPFHL